MKKNQILIASAIAVLGAAVSAPVLAEERAGFRMSGVVQTICRLEFSNSIRPGGEDVINFGSFTQLCNARSGYRVTMSHPANMGGATLLLDGRSVQLSDGNETIIVDEGHPVFKTSSARLDISNVAAPVNSFSFRIEPKGATY